MRHRQIETEGLTFAVAEAGEAGAPALVLLHGWPQTSLAFEGVMQALAADHHLVAPDLPAVGLSRGAPPAADKRTLARCIRGLIAELGLKGPILAGHDVGGMIAFAFLRDYPQDVRGVVIMDTVIPGVDPWEEVRRNPHIWHFAFHLVPNLPEILVAGRQGAYFDFFFDILASDKGAITPAARQAYGAAYERPEALKAGFDWYRAFEQDAKDNAVPRSIDTPVLYLRGEHETGDLAAYVEGLRKSGLAKVQIGLIPGSGHFAPEENPAAVAARLKRFVAELTLRKAPARSEDAR